MCGGCEAILAHPLPLMLPAQLGERFIPFTKWRTVRQNAVTGTGSESIENDRFPSHIVFRCRRATGTVPVGEKPSAVKNGWVPIPLDPAVILSMFFVQVAAGRWC